MLADIVLSLAEIALIGYWFRSREGSSETETNTLNGLFACLSVIIIVLNFAE